MEAAGEQQRHPHDVAEAPLELDHVDHRRLLHVDECLHDSCARHPLPYEIDEILDRTSAFWRVCAVRAGDEGAHSGSSTVSR